MNKLLVTVDEAAKSLSIGRTKAYELVASGIIPTVRIGRCVRVPVSVLVGLVDGPVLEKWPLEPQAPKSRRLNGNRDER
jgi:excisionase family DNA binding protein